MTSSNKLLHVKNAIWYGREYADDRQWIYVLDKRDLAEIGIAMQNLDPSLSISEITKHTFYLPHLGRRLHEIREEVIRGKGFYLIRGLPIAEYTRREILSIYWGLGLYFGDPVPQNNRGHLIGHVKDMGNDHRNPLTRIYTTNYLQPYHTDSCDVVGLLCIQAAKAGGLSSFSSSTTIYHEMKKTRPDLVAVLQQPFFVDRKGEIPKGKLPYYQLAVFHKYGKYLTTIYARDFIEAAQRHLEVPRLTTTQKEALDYFDELAAREDIRLDMELEIGDIQLLHNHQIVHSRTSYTDFPEPERRRHLLRLWLSTSLEGRPLPPAFEERYGSLMGDRRGGIRVPGMEEWVPLEAE